MNVDLSEIAKFEALASRWWDVHSEFKPLHEINPLRMRFISEQINLAEKKVLDVGCGGGILSEAMAQQGADVTAIDMGDAALAVAKLHQLESKVSVSYQKICVEQLARQKQAHFDIITCLEMLEHVPDPASVIKASAAMLKPGGHLFFSTINRNPKAYLLAILGAEYMLKLLPQGTHDYAKFIRPAELASWCRENQLDLQHSIGLSYNPLTKKYKLNKDISVNYMLHLTKPISNSPSTPLPSSAPPTNAPPTNESAYQRKCRKMTSVKLVLFDLDGTLIDTAKDFHIILNQLLKENSRMTISMAEVRKTVSSGARALIKLAFNIEESHREFESLRRRLLDLYAKQLEQTSSTLFPGIEQLLGVIENNKILWGIVTNKPSIYTLALLTQYRLLENCATVVCPDHVTQPKPDPEALLLACKQLSCVPQETIYIGDHPRDIEAGKNAGMRTLAAAYGYLPDVPAITEWHADQIVASANEITHWLLQQ